MSLKLGPPVYSLPQCPHLKRQYCTWLSSHIGKLVLTTGPRCQLHCQSTGPFCGRYVSDESAAKFVGKVLSQDFDEKFLARVWKRYQRPTQVAVPDVWPSIKAALSEIYAKPYFRKIFLTGSLLVKNKFDHKDYDVVILVNNIDDFLADENSHQDFNLHANRGKSASNTLFPNKINGINVDYFVRTVVHPFFATLDPDSGVLHSSPYFDLNLVPDPNIRLVKVYNPAYKDEMTRVLLEIADRVKRKMIIDDNAVSTGDQNMGIPESDWPVLVRTIARFRRADDQGVGDSLARVFNVIPIYRGMGIGDAFKHLLQSIGRPCNCNNRQQKLNELYPYVDPGSS
ncbi:MAG: hypothetical protein H7144_09580 [Burkholderiales bacterium]|nr:hypothetical protein [Phycisphaerae bacterium]